MCWTWPGVHAINTIGSPISDLGPGVPLANLAQRQEQQAGHPRRTSAPGKKDGTMVWLLSRNEREILLLSIVVAFGRSRKHLAHLLVWWLPVAVLHQQVALRPASSRAAWHWGIEFDYFLGE